MVYNKVDKLEGHLLDVCFGDQPARKRTGPKTAIIIEILGEHDRSSLISQVSYHFPRPDEVRSCAGLHR